MLHKKEIALYLCELCLKTGMIFEPFMKQSMKDEDYCFSSIFHCFLCCKLNVIRAQTCSTAIFVLVENVKNAKT